MSGIVESASYTYQKDGNRYFRITTCKSCGAEIVWVETANGKRMPCDAAEVAYWARPKAKGRVMLGTGYVISCDFRGEGPPTGLGRVPHWATCPNADRHRKGGAMREYIASMTFEFAIKVPDDFDPEKHYMPLEEHLKFLRYITKRCKEEIEMVKKEHAKFMWAIGCGVKVLEKEAQCKQSK